jgi:hypothetical protein
MSSPAPIDRLRRLAAGAEHWAPGDCAWISAAFMAVLTGKAKSLDHALGIVSRGTPPAILDRKGRRDVILREYAGTFYGEMDAGPQAAIVASDIKQFETRTWFRMETGGDLPAHMIGTKSGLLFAAFRLGPMPKSPKRLRAILGNPIPPSNFQRVAAI